MMEMARPNMVIPKLIGNELSERYNKISNAVRNCLKYGIDIHGNELYDSDDERAYGIPDERLQERTYRWIYFILNEFNIPSPDSKTFIDDFKQELKNSQSHMKELLISNKDWSNSTTTKLTIGIGRSILKKSKYFKSNRFIDKLLDPTNLANYILLYYEENITYRQLRFIFLQYSSVAKQHVYHAC